MKRKHEVQSKLEVQVSRLEAIQAQMKGQQLTAEQVVEALEMIKNSLVSVVSLVEIEQES